MINRALTERERKIYGMIPNDDMTFRDMVDIVRKAVEIPRCHSRKLSRNIENIDR